MARWKEEQLGDLVKRLKGLRGPRKGLASAYFSPKPQVYEFRHEVERIVSRETAKLRTKSYEGASKATIKSVEYAMGAILRWAAGLRSPPRGVAAVFAGHVVDRAGAFAKVFETVEHPDIRSSGLTLDDAFVLAPLEDVLEREGELERRRERDRISALMSELKKQVARRFEGNFEYGFEEVLDAVATGRARAVLVSTSLEKRKICSQCLHEARPSERQCGRCGGAVESMLEVLAKTCNHSNIEIHSVDSRWADGRELDRRFIGVAAILRFSAP